MQAVTYQLQLVPIFNISATAYSMLIRENEALLQAHFNWVVAPFTLEQSKQRLNYLMGMWKASEAFHFGIVNDHQQLMGEIAIDALHVKRYSGNASYWVSKKVQGLGMATQALLLLAHWAKDNLPLQYLEIKMTADNTASKKVAQKAGAALVQTIPDHRLVTGEVATVCLFKFFL